jgi:polar amino acid transport system ATP-binding protein/sulfate transport system ATP-binding protein
LVERLRVEDVAKSFSQPSGQVLHVIKGISMSIVDIPGRGQVRSILGPSGCGKTTLFRVIAGLDTPDTGRVLLGPDMTLVVVGKVGVIFQSYSLFEHMTVIDNLVQPARFHGTARAEARHKAEEYLEFFNLTSKKNSYPLELSGGQRQRVAIIQQLMTEKHFLVMDEPFSGLDMVNGLRLVEMLARVTATDTFDVTILIVTHDISMAIAVSDRIHLIGRSGEGTGPASLVREYDLVARGLAYQPDITALPEYHVLRREIADEFQRL